MTITSSAKDISSSLLPEDAQEAAWRRYWIAHVTSERGEHWITEAHSQKRPASPEASELEVMTKWRTATELVRRLREAGIGCHLSDSFKTHQ